MLKFLRKYQLILLAVGGSLLMVVFLLQPVLQQLTPDPRKRTIATIGDQKITMGDQIRANTELDLLDRFYADLAPLMGLADEEDRTAHWILLKHEADRLGVMGVQRDGADWIEELALVVTQREIQRRQQFGQPVSPEDAEEISRIVYEGLLQRRQAFVERSRGLTPAQFDTVLSQARGVMRLRQLYSSGPQLTRDRAAATFVENGTGVLTDQIVIGPEAVLDQVGEPTEDEIQAFFDRYKDTLPGNTDEAEGGNPYGFGFTLPPRLKLEWLALERSSIADVVQADPVAVRRRWQRENPDGGDFDADRGAIEQAIRDETVERILTDADEMVRGEILNQIRELEKEGIYRVVPAGWLSPDLEAIAGDVVESIQERHGVRIARPTVSRRSAAWQMPSDLFGLPGVGQAAFQVGNQRAVVYQLPEMVRGIGEDARIAVQPKVPIIDPPATGADGSRYYITVLEARGESPPDDSSEIRDRIVENIKQQRAFELLSAQVDAYREAAVAGGLAAVGVLARSADGQEPMIATDIFVLNDTIVPATASRPNPAGNRPAFREAVMERAKDLDPLAEPDSFSGPDSIVVTALPGSRSVVVAKIRAKRPPTLAEFQRLQTGVVVREVRGLISEAEAGEDPLSFAALVDRLGYESVGGVSEDDEG